MDFNEILNTALLARDAQAKLALIVAHCLSVHLSICVSVRDSLSHAYVRALRVASHVDYRLVLLLFTTTPIMTAPYRVCSVWRHYDVRVCSH